MRLAHVADLHFGAANPDVIAAARDAILNFNPAGLIVSGDLTQRGKRSEFADARDWIEQFDLPTLVVPGNHDTPLLNVHARAMAPFARYTDYFGHFTRPLDIGDVRVDPLNTARGWQARHNWAEGSVRLSDLQDVIVAGEGKRRVRLIACHHPFKSLRGALLRTETKRGELASQMLAESRIDAILTGHVHTPHAEEIVEPGGRYLAISAGTLSLRLRRAPPSFNMLEVQQDALEVTPMSLADNVFQPLAPFRFGLDGQERGSG